MQSSHFHQAELPQMKHKAANKISYSSPLSYRRVCPPHYTAVSAQQYVGCEAKHINSPICGRDSFRLMWQSFFPNDLANSVDLKIKPYPWKFVPGLISASMPHNSPTEECITIYAWCQSLALYELVSQAWIRLQTATSLTTATSLC